MKKVVVSIVGVCLVSSLLFFTYNNAEGNIRKGYKKPITVKEQKQEIESLKNKAQDILSKKGLSDEDAKEYNKTIEELGNKQIEYGLFDYKEELNARISTIEVAISDMEREMSEGSMPKDKIPDAEYRIKKLTPVLDKYKGILKEAENRKDYNYEELSNQFNDEIEKVYSEIN